MATVLFDEILRTIKIYKANGFDQIDIPFNLRGEKSYISYYTRNPNQIYTLQNALVQRGCEIIPSLLTKPYEFTIGISNFK